MKKTLRSTMLPLVLLGTVGLVATRMPAQQAAASSGAPAPRLTGIAHVAIRVTDLATSRAFYEKLGFTQPFELKDKDGKTTESFIKLNDRQFIELYPSDPAHPPSFQHVCFEAVNLEGLHEMYAARGLATPAVRKAGAGNLLIAWKGPEGQTEEITEYLPGSRHSSDFGKDLGADRISEKLIAAIVPMHDPRAAADFFVSGMGFVNEGVHDGAILTSPPATQDAAFGFLPGTSSEKLVLVLRVTSTKATEQRLKSLGLAALKQKGRPAVRDPDGNLIVFAPAGDTLSGKTR